MKDAIRKNSIAFLQSLESIIISSYGQSSTSVARWLAAASVGGLSVLLYYTVDKLTGHGAFFTDALHGKTLLIKSPYD
jgi:hypothetical protein